jgi:DNA (cytosine-5)-methyltransferase 1
MNPYLLKKPSQIRINRRLTAVDLFSGAGGISLGLLNAGFDVLFCSDHDETCALTHRRNFGRIPFEQASVQRLKGNDILRTTGLGKGELDLLIGGPPCQGFSIIGQREIWDSRNGLFREFLRLARELQPKCVVIENVPGLATLSKGEVLRQVGDAFSDAGYTIDCAELLAAQYGVPQMRWRVFFIGWRKDLEKRGGFPQPTHGRTGIGDLYPNTTISAADTAGFVNVRDAIGDLPAVSAGGVETQYGRAPVSLYQKAMRHSAPRALANHYAPKDEYDFSNAVRSKFFREGTRLVPPIHFDPEVLDYFAELANARRIALSSLVNTLLKKDIELIESGKMAGSAKKPGKCQS